MQLIKRARGLFKKQTVKDLTARRYRYRVSREYVGRDEFLVSVTAYSHSHALRLIDEDEIGYVNKSEYQQSEDHYEMTDTFVFNEDDFTEPYDVEDIPEGKE